MTMALLQRPTLNKKQGKPPDRSRHGMASPIELDNLDLKRGYTGLGSMAQALHTRISLLRCGG